MQTFHALIRLSVTAGCRSVGRKAASSERALLPQIAGLAYSPGKARYLSTFSYPSNYPSLNWADTGAAGAVSWPP